MDLIHIEVFNIFSFYLFTHCYSSRNFENIPQNGPVRIFAQETGDSQVSGHCGENKHRGLAVLVGLIVKLTCHGLGRGLNVNPWGERVLQKLGTAR